MLSNKVKRNIWLTLAILSFGVAIARTIRFIDGTNEWWELASAIVITALCSKYFIVYRKKVKQGNTYYKYVSPNS